MGPSRRALVFVAASACTLGACDALLGLNQYSDVACAFDCGVDVGPRPDVHEAADEALDVAQPQDVLGDVLGDGGPDAFDAGDGDASGSIGEGDAIAPDAPLQPTAHQAWAHWPMPNPDAAIGPWDGAPTLPHTMTYDAGTTTAGGVVVYDVVTGLSWRQLPDPASNLDDAWNKCVGHGSTWRVPTRIELVSLLDFTAAPPMLSMTAFPGAAAGSYWTSSSVVGPDGGASGVWTVSFSTGLTDNSGATASFVLCVSGGAK